MAEKISAEKMREMDTIELEKMLDELELKKMKATADARGTGEDPKSKMPRKAIKRNIARAKTILNERFEEGE